MTYAREHRPDLERAQLGVHRTGAAVKQRKGAYFPEVTAFASRDASTTDGESLHGGDFSTTLGLNVSYSLFNGGRRKAQVDEARKLREEAEHELTQTELDAAQDVRENVANVQNAQEQLILARTTAEYVQRNRDLVEKEYQAGQGSLARLNQAQRDLIESQSRLAQARVSLRLSWEMLHTATGRNMVDIPPPEIVSP